MNKQQHYEMLVKAYYNDLYRYAWWLSGNRNMAEDLVQETCLRAWKSLHTLKDEQAAKAWLMTILRREHARQWHKENPYKFVDIEQITLPDSAHNPEQQAEIRQLHKAISKLPHDYREALVLQVIGGFSGEEIANILKKNKNTIMTHLFRARNQLKQEFTTTDKGVQHYG